MDPDVNFSNCGVRFFLQHLDSTPYLNKFIFLISSYILSIPRNESIKYLNHIYSNNFMPNIQFGIIWWGFNYFWDHLHFHDLWHGVILFITTYDQNMI